MVEGVGGGWRGLEGVEEVGGGRGGRGGRMNRNLCFKSIINAILMSYILQGYRSAFILPIDKFLKGVDKILEKLAENV